MAIANRSNEGEMMDTAVGLMSAGERLGALLVGFGMVVLLIFFVLHQTGQTGFFNENFGTLEMLLLYVPIGLSIVDYGIQAATGQHRPARPFAAASGILLGLAALWFLLVHFPFEFPHLGDVLPEALRPLLGWVTNDLGKIPLVIQVFAGPVGAFQAIRAFLAGG